MSRHTNPADPFAIEKRAAANKARADMDPVAKDKLVAQENVLIEHGYAPYGALGFGWWRRTPGGPSMQVGEALIAIARQKGKELEYPGAGLGGVADLALRCLHDETREQLCWLLHRVHDLGTKARRYETELELIVGKSPPTVDEGQVHALPNGQRVLSKSYIDSLLEELER